MVPNVIHVHYVFRFEGPFKNNSWWIFAFNDFLNFLYEFDFFN